VVVEAPGDDPGPSNLQGSTAPRRGPQIGV
jgi:hypothetical protein